MYEWIFTIGPASPDLGPMAIFNMGPGEIVVDAEAKDVFPMPDVHPHPFKGETWESVGRDMGHKTRLATPNQQRAIRIRDTGCIVPSCDRPAQWCDIHHIKPYARGGETSINNMVCLCRRHHTLIHNSKWTIQPNPDGTFTVRHPIRAP